MGQCAGGAFATKVVAARDMKVLAVKVEIDSRGPEPAFSFLKKWIDVRLDHWEAP
jgi:hypothetical protein